MSDRYPNLFLKANDDYGHLYGQNSPYEPVLSSHSPLVENSLTTPFPGSVFKAIASASHDVLIRSGNAVYTSMHMQLLQVRCELEAERKTNAHLQNLMEKIAMSHPNPMPMASETGGQGGQVSTLVIPDAPESLEEDDYLDVPFWRELDWTKHIDRQRDHGHVDSKLGFLTDKDGHQVSESRVKDIMFHAKQAWAELYYHRFDPGTWTKKTPTMTKYFVHSMKVMFQEFLYCDGDWKVERFAIIKYPDWCKGVWSSGGLTRLRPSKRKDTDCGPKKEEHKRKKAKTKLGLTPAVEVIDLDGPEDAPSDATLVPRAVSVSDTVPPTIPPSTTSATLKVTSPLPTGPAPLRPPPAASVPDTAPSTTAPSTTSSILEVASPSPLPTGPAPLHPPPAASVPDTVPSTTPPSTTSLTPKVTSPSLTEPAPLHPPPVASVPDTVPSTTPPSTTSATPEVASPMPTGLAPLCPPPQSMLLSTVAADVPNTTISPLMTAGTTPQANDTPSNTLDNTSLSPAMPMPPPSSAPTGQVSTERPRSGQCRVNPLAGVSIPKTLLKVPIDLEVPTATPIVPSAARGSKSAKAMVATPGLLTPRNLFACDYLKDHTPSKSEFKAVWDNIDSETKKKYDALSKQKKLAALIASTAAPPLPNGNDISS